jgi:hypothetical protein
MTNLAVTLSRLFLCAFEPIAIALIVMLCS